MKRNSLGLSHFVDCPSPYRRASPLMPRPASLSLAHRTQRLARIAIAPQRSRGPKELRRWQLCAHTHACNLADHVPAKIAFQRIRSVLAGVDAEVNALASTGRVPHRVPAAVTGHHPAACAARVQCRRKGAELTRVHRVEPIVSAILRLGYALAVAVPARCEQMDLGRAQIARPLAA